MLTAARRAGQACAVCEGTDDVTKHVGWLDGVSIKVHTYHLENYRYGERIPPERTGAQVQGRQLAVRP